MEVVVVVVVAAIRVWNPSSTFLCLSMKQPNGKPGTAIIFAAVSSCWRVYVCVCAEADAQVSQHTLTHKGASQQQALRALRILGTWICSLAAPATRLGKCGRLHDSKYNYNQERYT